MMDDFRRALLVAAGPSEAEALTPPHHCHGGRQALARLIDDGRASCRLAGRRRKAPGHHTLAA